MTEISFLNFIYLFICVWVFAHVYVYVSYKYDKYLKRQKMTSNPLRLK